MKQGSIKKAEGSSWRPQGPRVARQRPGASVKSVAAAQEQQATVPLPGAAGSPEEATELPSLENNQQRETVGVSSSPGAPSFTGATRDGCKP